MRVNGITFVGTITPSRAAMTAFVRDVLGLAPAALAGSEADVFALPDGSSFAVAPSHDGDPAERTVGFLVDDVDAAAAELRAAGVPTDDEVTANARYRFVHFRAPDGRLYELVEDLGSHD